MIFLQIFVQKLIRLIFFINIEKLRRKKVKNNSSARVLLILLFVVKILP